MKQNTFSQKAMLVFSLALLVLIIAVFSWIWFGATRPEVSAYKSKEKLTPISVAGLESQAKKILDSLKNNSGIPIPEPTAKEGRVDPFAAL
ncbi:MAG: hypothetical protein NTY30_00460 [Candidatus Berkelbacteria bacterium]|nr:hypothetical protein [Candidatus Berkelbacteria bacterium]